MPCTSGEATDARTSGFYDVRVQVLCGFKNPTTTNVGFLCDVRDGTLTRLRAVPWSYTKTPTQMLTKRLATNVLMNWAAMAVNMAVPFFLTPFVVRHLGQTGYGVWIIAVSIVSYLNLLDLGLRSAVVRFVSQAQSKGELPRATAAIQAALWVRVLIAAGVSVLSLALAYVMPRLFKLPPDLVHAGQITTLLCALGVAVSLVAGVFGAVLTAINRFDLLSYITMAQTITRAVGVLLILRSGRGLIPLAAWELTVMVLVGSATTLTALRCFPASRTRVQRPEMPLLRSIWSYSFTTFIFIIAVQIITNTDNLVVGAFRSVGDVTLYAIGGSLVGYAYQVSGALSSTFTPLASGLEASGRFDELRAMLIRGTQATLALALPVAIGLATRGETFIRLWMGPQYGHPSEVVLRILLISMFFGVGDATAGSIMMATDRHRPVARWAVYEAILNLGLSILLIRKMGFYGVAWGTTISMAFTHLAFWPRYLKKTLDVQPSIYMLQGWGKIMLCALPFAALSWLAERFWQPQHLLVFFAQIIVTLPVYAGCVVLAFPTETRKVLPRWRGTRQPATPAVQLQ